MTEPELRIRKLVAHCRVPAGTSADRRLSAALADRLGAPLEQALHACGQDGFWLLRRVDVRTGVGAEWTTGQMADAVARGIGASVRQQARRGRDAADVLWFPDRATYVAEFLLDLARGRAAGRWEYDGFAPLGDWSDVASRLADADLDGLVAALIRLTAAELDELGERVAGDRFLERLAGSRRGTGAVLTALRGLRSVGGPAANASTGLVLAVTATRHGAALGDVARPALDVADLLRLLAGADAGRVPPALAAGRWAEVLAATGPSDAFLPIVRWSADDRADLAGVLAEPTAGPPLHTRFGGAFLLLPLLPDLCSWTEATAAWPGVAGVGADRLARLVVLASALGTARFAAAVRDPLLRTALAVPDDVDVPGWLESLDPVPFAEATGLELADDLDPWLHAGPNGFPGVAAAALLAELGRRLPGLAASSPSYLWHNVLDVDAQVALGRGRALVELGHAPLGVLLSMTGLASTSFVVDGAEELRWTLTSRS